MNRDYFIDWADFLDDDEKKAYGEIQQWEERPPSQLSLMKSLTVPLINEARKLSPDLADKVAAAVKEALTSLRDYAGMTVIPDSIENKIKAIACSMPASGDGAELYTPLACFDRAARECILFNTAFATVEGVMSGALGITGMLIDIPMLYTMLFRVIQETGLCFGYFINSPEEKLYVMKILELGHTPEDSARKEAIGELYTLHKAISGGVSLNTLKAKGAITGFEAVSEKIAAAFSRRRLRNIFMLAGGILGGAANFALTRQVADAAFHTYRRRFIMDRARARMSKRL
ncbi:MAG: EcsC family protein [Candidatus Eremiobacteraeota bacterium]|nr:EcsC family protein [Candidatus Eremiobacteraeota bacterium]